MKKRILSLLLALALLMPLLPTAFSVPSQAIAPLFFETHSDWHFDLTKEPDRPMTVEELIALSTAYSFWATGTPDGETPRDKNGDLPAEWAAPYIRYYAKAGAFDPARVDYDAPATLGFLMRFYVSSRGKYGFNANNLYTFTGTEGYNTDELLLLNVAVDYGIWDYTPGMDVSQANLLRRDLESKYLIPINLPEQKPTIEAAKGYPWSMVYFEETYDYWGFADREEAKIHELENVKAAGKNINMVTLNIQLLRQDGRYGYFLEQDRVPMRPVHGELIEYCKENDIKILCGVFNYYEATTLQAMKDHPEYVELVADELTRSVDLYGFDGLNLDIEMFTKEYRNEESALLRALSARMKARGKLLVSTVGAYFNDASEAESLYDYNVIRDTCDLVMVILYDDHSVRNYTTNPNAEAGYVSHYEGMRRRIIYAATRLGADKVIMSVATYGVDFNLSRPDHTAVALTRQEINDLIRSTGATVQTNGMPIDDAYFSYTDARGDRHEVYFDSDEGIMRRLDYATQFGLAGVCAYYVGSDTPAVFERMGQKLVDLPFRDVEKSWYYEPVRWAVQNEITSGTSQTTFSPDQSCTRAQVVTFLWRTAGQPRPKNPCPFTDVPAGTWYTDAVAWAVENGITTGTGNNRFSPDQSCTRAQIVTFLWRFAKTPEAPAGTPFDDVAPGAYYEKAVAWAADRGVTTGTSAKTFSPDAVCTRAQIVTFLYRDQTADSEE